MKNKIEIAYVLICSVLLAIFWVPTLFLGDIISYNFDILPFIYFGFMAILYALMLKSNKLIESFVKWGISIPISYWIFKYFWKTNYALRSLNWVIKGYGKQSAGGAFASFFYCSTFCFFCILAVLFIGKLKISDYKSFQKIQACVGSLIGIVIVVVTFILESMFPSYSSIFSG